MRDLISISIAAITRYSAASSRFFVPHDLDVLEILAREPRHRNIEDVEIFLANQVQKQVERTLELLEEDLQRVGRNVEIAAEARSPARRRTRNRRSPPRRMARRLPIPVEAICSIALLQ